jgi:predicted Zn-dependent protease
LRTDAASKALTVTLAVRALLLCSCIVATVATHAHPGPHDQLLHIDRIIAEHPDEQSAYIKRAAIHSEAGEFELANADFERAEDLGPAAQVALERGIHLYRSDEPERSIEYLSRYIKQFPNDPIAYEYRARVARALGDRQQAVADLRSYFALQEQPNPGNYLAIAELLTQSQEPAQALAVLDDGLKTLGLIPQLQRRAIELELVQNNLDGAITRLETLRMPLRESASWHLEMAELLAQDNRADEATMLVEDALMHLSNLRPTPANIALQQRAVDMQSRLQAPESQQKH